MAQFEDPEPYCLVDPAGQVCSLEPSAAPATPSATAPTVSLVRVARPRSPEGLVLGFREFWPKFDVLTAALETRLRDRWQLPAVHRIDGTRPRGDEAQRCWETFIDDVDWAVCGLGGCGGCTPWAVYDAVELERQGVPTVTMVTTDLMELARRTARQQSAENLRIVSVPPYLDDLTDQEIPGLADDLFDELVAALVTPLGDGEG